MLCTICGHPLDDHNGDGRCNICHRDSGPCQQPSQAERVQFFITTLIGVPFPVDMPAEMLVRWAARALAELLHFDPNDGDYGLIDCETHTLLDMDSYIGAYGGKMLHLAVSRPG